MLGCYQLSLKRGTKGVFTVGDAGLAFSSLYMARAYIGIDEKGHWIVFDDVIDNPARQRVNL